MITINPLHPDVSVAPTDYGAVLLDQRTGRYWQVGRTAQLLLELAGEGRDASYAVDALISRFDVDETTARRDIDGFFAALARENLLER